MEYILKIENLNKSYKDKKVLKDISFNVKKGGIFSFLGLNGAGKSTTINIICQVLKKDSGKIYLNNLDLDLDSQKIKEQVGIVFQGSSLDKELSIYENLKLKADLFNIKKKTFLEQLSFLDNLLDLKPLLNKKYPKLSGGQKRRCDIAQGLINSPKVLFLDEPTTGLDPINRNKVWEAIEELIKKNDITVFLTTHYMEEAEKSNEIVIIDDGCIIAKGSPNELKEKYSKTQIKFHKEFSEKDFNLLKCLFKNVVYENNHYLIKTNDATDVLSKKEIKDFLKDFEVIKGSMQDVFLEVSGKRFENV